MCVYNYLVYDLDIYSWRRHGGMTDDDNAERSDSLVCVWAGG